MASYPNNIYSPREKKNRSGIEYDPEKKTVIFVEDIKKLDEEVVAIETELGLNFKRNRLDPNLYLYLPFEEGKGTITKDISGWANHGKLMNGPTWNNGKVGQCLNFDGIDDYVDCGNGESLNFTDTITIETWIKFNSELLGKRGDIVNKQQEGYKGYALLKAINNTIILQVASGSAWNPIASTTTVNPNTWYHIVAQNNANYRKIYINGVKSNEATGIAAISLSTINLRVGMHAEGRTPFMGLIDEVKIYNRILSEDEILDHYLHP